MVLFFRAFQQWIGGLGVVLMIISVLAKPGSISAKLYQSEAREERIKPSTKATVKQIIKIYLVYTLFGIILYVLAGMPVFDSVCNTFCIISTGGMSIKNANIGFYQNDVIYFITIILMILGATSFLVHFRIIKTRGKSFIRDLQFKTMISLIAVSSILIYFISNILPMDIVFALTTDRMYKNKLKDGDLDKYNEVEIGVMQRICRKRTAEIKRLYDVANSIAM